MTLKTLVADGLAEAGVHLLEGAGPVTVQPKITAAELLTVIPEYHALVVRSRTKVTAEVLAAGVNLKVVGRAGVGVDNIDLAAAEARGVTVVNSPQAATTSVAELTLALMLALARQVPAADAALKQGRWEKSALMGSELAGKTLGIIGLGRIGSEVVRRARVFEMNVLAYDPRKSVERIHERGAEPASLDELLARSDYLSLHLPHNAETHKLLDASRLAQMKRGARLLCLARGGLIDEDALRAALDAGHLAGAGLDVFAAEPPPPGSLAAHPKVIATPHIGAQTQEAQMRAGLAIAAEVLAVLQGREPRWKVSAGEE
ncbi:MAG: hydroxyacid dehydrogenase [Anaerolineales bacterium]|nr:hydroxyacid dehydrogenase [Anaerolineales bacterium]